MREPRIFLDGLTWPESPRWDGASVWTSDVHNFRLVEVSIDGRVVREIKVPQRPAGIDFIGDGELLVASALDQRLQIIATDEQDPSINVVADLSAMTGAYLNDLISHPDGWSYVGDTGFVFGQDEPKRNGRIIGYHRDNGPKIVAEEIFFPNGMVVSPDGGTLFVAETFGNAVTAFDVTETGMLENRREHLALPSKPDGLCMDAEGCLWVPLLNEARFVRASQNGELIDEISIAHDNAISCVFGGPHRSTLFLGAATISQSESGETVRRGAIYAVEMPFAGVGRP